jgi:phage terminase large subunit-like protein
VTEPQTPNPEDYDLPERLRKIDKARKERPWRYYPATPVLRDGFHSSHAKIRLLTGPNRGRKTTAGAWELMSYATGFNAIRDEHYPLPNVCWAVGLDRVNLGPIQRRAVCSIAPKGSRYYTKDDKLVLPEPWGSEIYFKVCESGREKFQGEGCLAIWFDEEWPGEEGLEIFKECLRRRKPGWELRLFMTMTPLLGYTWSYDYLYKKDSPKRFKSCENFEFSLYDCTVDKGGWLTEAEIKEWESEMDPYEIQARVFGQYTLVGGSPAFEPRALMNALERSQTGSRHKLRPGRFDNGLVVPVIEEDIVGDLVVFQKPQKNRQYIVGVDPAMGVRRDRSVASVWDRELPVEVAYFASNSVEPVQFARDAVAPLATYYNNALAVVESNSQGGGACISELQAVYGHLYMRQDFRQRDRSFTKSYGFRTDDYNRSMIFSTLKEMLPMPNFVPSEDLVKEMMNMIVDKTNKIDHMDGRHDDHVFAAGIALTVNRQNPRPQYEAWSRYRESYGGSDAWLGY